MVKKNNARTDTRKRFNALHADYYLISRTFPNFNPHQVIIGLLYWMSICLSWTDLKHAKRFGITSGTNNVSCQM